MLLIHHVLIYHLWRRSHILWNSRSSHVHRVVAVHHVLLLGHHLVLMVASSVWTLEVGPIVDVLAMSSTIHGIVVTTTTHASIQSRCSGMLVVVRLRSSLIGMTLVELESRL